MRPADPNWTDVAQVILVAAQLIVLIVAAGVAWRQVRDARRPREDQSRPLVGIDCEMEGMLVSLRISNMGTTLARAVRFESAPPLKSAIENPLDELKIFREG